MSRSTKGNAAPAGADIYSLARLAPVTAKAMADAAEAHDLLCEAADNEAQLAEAMLEAGAERATLHERFPLPRLPGVGLSYQRDQATGAWWLTSTEADRHGEPRTIYLCKPLAVVASWRIVDASPPLYGVRVRVQAADGRQVEIDVASGATATPAAVLADLLAAGAAIRRHGEQVVIDAIRTADPVERIVRYRRAGWHDLDDEEPLWLAPGQAIEHDGAQVEQIDAGAGRAAQRGTLDGWRAACDLLLSQAGMGPWHVGLATGLAGPLLDLLAWDSCGVLFQGATSRGKTTAQRLGASCVGTPAEGGALHRMSATVNSLESLFEGWSGGTIHLDELGAAQDGDAVKRAIFLLSGEGGKARATRDGQGLRGRKTWRVFATLSGETGLEQRVRDGGRGTVPAGLLARIPAVDFSTVGVIPQAVIEAALAGLHEHHGHALPAFVAHLVASGHASPEGRDRLRQRAQAILAGLLPAGAAGDLARQARPFAAMTLAAGLAAEAGILPAAFDVGAIAAAWRGGNLGDEGAAPATPQERALAELRLAILSRLGSEIQSTDPSCRPARQAIGWHDDECIYLPVGALCDLVSTQIGGEAGLLRLLDPWINRRKSAKNRLTDYVPGVGRVGRVVALWRSLIDAATDPPAA